MFLKATPIEPSLVSRVVSDEDLWRSFQNGEDAAFNMLYARYADRIYAYLKLLLTIVPEQLDDVFQEAWILIFKERGREFSGGKGAFGGWLFRVAHNMAISILRKDQHQTMSLEELQEPDKNPLSFPSLKFTQTPDDSKRLNDLKGPAIIISASGMATGGRIMHHLINRLPDPNTIVLFTGYQAEETLGRQLMEGAKSVSIFGQNIQVAARVQTLTNFSAHADQREIMNWLKQMPKPPKRLFLTHGEDGPRTVLKALIEKELGWNVSLPKLNEIVDLTTL